MTDTPNFAVRKERFLNRWHAARAVRSVRQAGGFVEAPEPRTVGGFARGRQLLAGNFLFAGHLLQQPQPASLWALDAPNSDYVRELQGFLWLDDLAAVGDSAARTTAKRWVWEWIDRYGRGRGPGWTADLTGRRVLRWISHGIFLLRGVEQAQSRDFFRSLARQTVFLSRRWQAAPSGLPQFEALAGLIYASLSLDGLSRFAQPALRGLDRACDTQIDEQGGVPSRNPEELLQVFVLLSWVEAALRDAGQEVSAPHARALTRIAPTLRTLRHADGSLARFHGGGRGMEGRLDHALAQSRVRTRHRDELAMGFMRLSGGRTSVVIDASAPAQGSDSLEAHASALAFELTSGRRPLIVNCGSGRTFGPEWRRAGRATPSHSTLSLDGYSSARLGPKDKLTGLETLIEGPTQLPINVGTVSDGMRFQGGHNGFVPTHGLSHARTLEMTFDGRAMAGEDMLLSLTETEKSRFTRALDASGTKGIAFDIRFHLHPEVDATLDLNGQTVSMALKSGEIWLFRHDGTHRMHIETSVYLESGRLSPRGTNQIVLSGHAMSYATRVRWSLAKAQETAVGVRDLSRATSELID